jgi:BlaI family penicillinase repressor
MQHLSFQENEIMKIIWGAVGEQITTRDIEARLAAKDGKNRNISSLMTVIARLVDKGFIDPVKKYRQSTYFMALIQETEYMAYASKQFIDRMHGGNLSSFVSTLLEADQCTQQDIEDLRNILDRNR